MKHRILIIVISVMLIAAFAVTLAACGAPKNVDESKVENFSGYQEKPDENKIKGDKFAPIDFSALKRDPLAILTKAIENTNNAKQQASFIVTNSDIISDARGELEELKRVLQRSTYLVEMNQEGSYTQTVSGMMKLETNSSGLNSIIDQIVGQFGYCRRSGNIDGKNYTSQGSSPKFSAKGDEITAPAGASASWKKWVESAPLGMALSLAYDKVSDEIVVTPMFEDRQDMAKFKSGVYKTGDGSVDYSYGDKAEYIYDPVTGAKCNYVNTVDPFNNAGSAKKRSGATYITSSREDGTIVPQYDMNYDVVDRDNCSVKKVKDYWEIVINFQGGASKYPDYYGSKIDQACRAAAGMLLIDTNNTPLKMGRIEYKTLKMTYQVWDNGFMKKMDREESFDCYAYFDVFIKSGEGLGMSNNSAYQVWSYTDEDTNVRAHIGLK